MPSPEQSDFSGDLEASIKHLLETAEDTPEDLKKQLEFGKVSQKEATSSLLEELRTNLQLEGERTLTLRNSQDARLELAKSIELAMQEDGELSQAELVTGLTKVLQEELIESALTVEDLSLLPVDELREMEKLRPGTLLFAFTTWGDKQKGLDVTLLGNAYLPQNGDSFTIDFRGNEAAYWEIGAADLMPPEVRGIKVLTQAGEERTSERRVGLKGETRGGFFDAEGYMPIFSKDVVTVHNVDPEIRANFFDPESETWNFEAYDEKFAADESSYLVIPSSINGEESGRIAHTKERASYGRSMESLKENEFDWFAAAQGASETFYRKLGVMVPVSTTFGVIAKESGFDPEAVSSSGCTGLGQFGRDAWTDFIRQNRSIAEAVLKAQGLEFPSSKADILALRTNPRLNIYATTWYLAKLGKRMGYQKVDSHSVKEVYLAYHEGFAGHRTLEKYIKTGRGKLHPWQRKNPEAYWKSLNAYARQVEVQAAQYERESSKLV